MENIINSTTEKMLEQELLSVIENKAKTVSGKVLREYMIGATGK